MDETKDFLKSGAQRILRIASFYWKPYSRLILYGDSSGWVLDWEIRELKRICGRLDVRMVKSIWKHAAQPQSIFFSNHFVLLNEDWMRLLPSRIGFSYFHGLPNTGDELFDSFHNLLRRHHEKITRIQVTHSQMRDVVLETGIDPSKVFLVPIGINLGFFPYRTNEQKRMMRNELGIPQSAFVIGSFQKDGVGWKEGLEPKLIKGPDVFLSVIRLLRKDIPELYVLLTGPSRGFVKCGLEEMGVPYKHAYYKAYPEVARMFSMLDLYIVTSRQEGGPKAILESMASGVPLVTTRVGQAMDLVKHGENAWMTDVEDVEALASHALQVYHSSTDALLPILSAGRSTAEANSYESQIPLWAEFMKGFVETS